MPTYEYRCPDGHDFEQFVPRISDGAGTLPCPVCGKTAVRQISAGGGLLFKGSGFYITDYGKDGKKDQRAKASDSGAKSDAKPAAESKPATDAKPAESKPAPKAAKSGGSEK